MLQLAVENASLRAALEQARAECVLLRRQLEAADARCGALEARARAPDTSTGAAATGDGEAGPQGSEIEAAVGAAVARLGLPVDVRRVRAGGGGGGGDDDVGGGGGSSSGGDAAGGGTRRRIKVAMIGGVLSALSGSGESVPLERFLKQACASLGCCVCVFACVYFLACGLVGGWARVVQNKCACNSGFAHAVLF